jgi:hypothetical protein
VRAQGPSPGFREWTVELERDVPDLEARAVALVVEKWGTSARVLEVDGRRVRVLGPDSESAIRDLRFALERPPAVAPAGRRSGRRK